MLRVVQALGCEDLLQLAEAKRADRPCNTAHQQRAAWTERKVCEGTDRDPARERGVLHVDGADLARLIEEW
jgi:hypothetical protein